MAETLKYGFTTGSCSAAAAKAACYMLLSGKEKSNISIETPKGIMFDAEILDIKRGENYVSCAVRKDGGDDPDVTTGLLIYARVSIMDTSVAEAKANVVIDGGEGVGRVTKPGLDQPVGNAAINHVPREMIEKEVREVCELLDYNGTINVLISVPGGDKTAELTFNPRLGIVGGISILGTSGIVEPMSEKALIDTIKVELSQKKALGYKTAFVSPGNYGLDFMKRAYDIDLDKSVKCSNYIGDTIDMAIELGFEKLLLTGHIGKLVKVAGGMMNTHSKEGDCRMEILSANAILAGGDAGLVRNIMDCVSTEEALKYITNYRGDIFAKTMQLVLDKILFYLNKRAKGKLDIECIVYSNDFGELVKSGKAVEYLNELRELSMI